jgi:outer membrane lipoprotein-sorting protein
MKAASVLVLVLAPVLLQDDEAEKASRAMETRILESKTLRLTYAMTVQVDSRKDEIKGNVWLGENNKARIEAKGTWDGKPVEMLVVSDGSKMIAKGPGGSSPMPRDTPRGSGELIRGTIARAGVFAGLFYTPQERKEPTLDELFQLSEFRVGNREKRGAREVLVIEHKIAFRGAKELGMITIWVDSKASLPEKRAFTINDSAHKVAVMEVYEGVVIDGKVDDDLFQLPK